MLYRVADDIPETVAHDKDQSPPIRDGVLQYTLEDPFSHLLAKEARIGGAFEISLGLIHEMPRDLYSALPPIAFQPLSFATRIAMNGEGTRVGLKPELELPRCPQEPIQGHGGILSPGKEQKDVATGQVLKDAPLFFLPVLETQVRIHDGDPHALRGRRRTSFFGGVGTYSTRFPKN
jgi:hypothetical protein